jgi:hypothetical protein
MNVLRFNRRFLIGVIVAGCCFFTAAFAEAATLSLSPATGVYQSGSTFTARVVLNSAGESINAAEGTLKFNPQELSVVSVNRSGSIFNLWVAEPSFSNSAGTISFSGGLPSGYTGSAGSVMNITFRVNGSGSSKVTFTQGSILANDGRGSNVLSSYGHGNYTLRTASVEPEQEVVIEYVPPANTPSMPQISSNSHPNNEGWYASDTATLSWNVPAGITAVRTLLDNNRYSIPTKVYDSPIESITLDDLDEGVQYFHLQFQNTDGWGTVAHYRLAVDTERPSRLSISQPEPDFTDPVQVLLASTTDETSGVIKYLVRVDDTEPFEVAVTASGTIQLPSLQPGYHTVSVEAVDAAGNSIVDTYSFTIEAFERPVFTLAPTEVPTDVIPVFKGQTRANAEVSIVLTKSGADPVTYTLQATDSGEFTFIPNDLLTNGVYDITARAVDEFGAQSDVSEPVRFAVQQPGYIRIGSLLVSVLSVVIPLAALVLLLVFLLLLVWRRIKTFRAGVTKESKEALTITQKEFNALRDYLRQQSEVLAKSRKTNKLTKAEAALIEEFDINLQAAEKRVKKEIIDVTELTDKQN